MHYETHKFLCQLCPAEFESNNSYHNHIAKHPDLAFIVVQYVLNHFKNEMIYLDMLLHNIMKIYQIKKVVQIVN